MGFVLVAADGFGAAAVANQQTDSRDANHGPEDGERDPETDVVNVEVVEGAAVDPGCLDGERLLALGAVGEDESGRRRKAFG